MKTELIKTDNYLLVVDGSEIKEGDWLVANDKDIMQMKSDYDNDMSNEVIWVGDYLNGYATCKDNCKKIIAHLPLNNSPILEGVPLLPPLEVEDDAKILADKEFVGTYIVDIGLDINPAYREGFVIGYNKAREKYKFTEEDMRKAADWYFETNGEKPIEELIESLSQPKMPTHFEFEMERGFQNELGDFYYSLNSVIEVGKTTPICRIKTTINSTTTSQSQVIAWGKYIY